MDVRLRGLFTLRSPLSHISDSIGTQTYLVQEPVRQPDGSYAEVAVYSGNAWRGQLRDLCAVYMLRRIGSPLLSLDAFHLLFTGGRIGGEQVVDLEKARAYRRVLPLVAIFGGGVGNQILPGKLRVANCYPLCREALAVLSPAHHATANQSSYRAMTFEKSFSRKDDAKDDRLRVFLADAERDGQPSLPGAEPEPKAAKRDGPADQMRMTSELLAAGTLLETEISLSDVSEIELGALVSALDQFARAPFIGGQSGRGHGHVSLRYELLDLETGEVQPFVSVESDLAELAPPAAGAKAAYDDYLREQYDRYLTDQSGQIRQMLGAG